MKISEMTNKQAKECMIRLCGPFSRICEDKKTEALLASIEIRDGESVVQAIARILPEAAAYAFQSHGEDFNEIIGALLMVPAGKVDEMNFAETVAALKNSYDDVLAAFFTNTAVGKKKNGGKSA